jgi:hypothetical protein
MSAPPQHQVYIGSLITVPLLFRLTIGSKDQFNRQCNGVHNENPIESTTPSGEVRVRNTVVSLFLGWSILPILLRCQKP